jgi:hypothetical protein
LKVPNLTPGLYTLSMQVRADSAPHVYLQLMGGANGAMAQYLLRTSNIWTTRLGEGHRIHATIRSVDDQWFQLTLTSNLDADTGVIIIQLADKRGNREFRPRGDPVIFRGVMLERGGTATSYPGITAGSDSTDVLPKMPE